MLKIDVADPSIIKSDRQQGRFICEKQWQFAVGCHLHTLNAVPMYCRVNPANQHYQTHPRMAPRTTPRTSPWTAPWQHLSVELRITPFNYDSMLILNTEFVFNSQYMHSHP